MAHAGEKERSAVALTLHRWWHVLACGAHPDPDPPRAHVATIAPVARRDAQPRRAVHADVPANGLPDALVAAPAAARPEPQAPLAEPCQPSPKSAGPAQRLMAGDMSVEEIRSIVAQGRWTPARCVALGPVPDQLVQQWLVQGDLPRETYLALSVAHWQPHQVLPLLHSQHAASFKTPGELLLAVDMPGPANSPKRQAFATRMLAALALSKMGIKPTLVAAHLPPADACHVCGDADVVALEACAHGADVCSTCVKSWMTQGASPHRCPSEGCKAALTPNDALRVGAGAAIAHQLAAFLAQKVAAQQAHWRPCGTDDCVGGVEVPSGTSYVKFDCGVCGVHQRILGRSAEGDLQQIHQMVLTFLNRAAVGRAMLPCHHCGLPSVKISGCLHVRCPACQQAWNFVPRVPKAGSMVDMGLFDGLPRGAASSTQIANAVRDNCRRLALFQEFT